jgi:hypothetical protein
MKTPEELAEEYCNTKQLSYLERLVITKGFIDGYKEGFEAGCIKGSMAMQSTLDEDCHFTPIVDHKKLAGRLSKKKKSK